MSCTVQEPEPNRPPRHSHLGVSVEDDGPTRVELMATLGGERTLEAAVGDSCSAPMSVDQRNGDDPVSGRSISCMRKWLIGALRDYSLETALRYYRPSTEGYDRFIDSMLRCAIYGFTDGLNEPSARPRSRGSQRRTAPASSHALRRRSRAQASRYPAQLPDAKDGDPSRQPAACQRMSKASRKFGANRADKSSIGTTGKRSCVWPIRRPLGRPR